MNYEILAEELAGETYNGLTDAEAADLLNQPLISSRRRVPISALHETAYGNGVLAQLNVAMANPETPGELRIVCKLVIDLVNARFNDVDLDSPAATQMFGTLVQYGIISEAQADSLDDLANVSTSRAQFLGLGGKPDVGDVRMARAGGW